MTTFSDFQRSRQIRVVCNLLLVTTQNQQIDIAVAFGQQTETLQQQVDTLTANLAAARSERDEHQSARGALDRRLSDALDLLSTLDELKTQAGQLEAALVAVEAAKAQKDEAALEIDRLRRQVIVLDRLVAALKARLKRGLGE